MGTLMDVQIKYDECWAKTTPSGQPGISVEQHCRTAGVVAGLLATKYPDWLKDSLDIRTGIILAALHDVGKVSPGFQKKCFAWLKQRGLTAAEFAGMEEDHAKISQKTLQDFMAGENLLLWAAIVGAHHGKLKGNRLSSLCDGGEAWAAERLRLVEGLVREFGLLPARPPPNFDCGALWFNAGLIAVADWLASDENTFPPSKELDTQAIRERAEQQLARIGFQPILCPEGKTFADLFPFPPNSLQKLMTQAVIRPGVYVVEAAMGCGKTEAALIAAYNLVSSGQATGLYFALPTQVTSNRIHKRVAAFIEKIESGAGTRLIHGNSWLVESAQPLTDSRNGDTTKVWTGRDWFASPRRALLAPFGVGTIDQALLGVVAARHFFVRQFGLAGKVVILDEVHSYDLYTGTLLDQLVTRLRELGETVIILSATLTAKRRRKLLGLPDSAANKLDSAYPLISSSVGSEHLQKPVPPDLPKTIQIRFRSATELVNAALERAQRGQCVLWIKNTVNDAQEIYRHLRGQNRAGGPEIALLHARFPQFRREQLENDWLERIGKDQTKRPPNGCVLVSTQIAEQSVDIDADLLITDLAPTDMLLQRLGRLWRHPRQRPVDCNMPEAWIANPALDAVGLRAAIATEIKTALGKSAKVYAPYVLLRTFDLWRELTTLTLPADIRPILEATYTDPPKNEPNAWRELRKELETRKEKLRNAAIANGNPWQIQLDDEEGVQTRWNSRPTTSVLLARRIFACDQKNGASLELLNGNRCELRPGVFDFAAAQALIRNLVKVPSWCVKNNINSTPAWLREYARNGVLLCKVCDEKLVLLQGGAETGLTYRNDLGVVIPPWQAAAAELRRHAEEDDDESYD